MSANTFGGDTEPMMTAVMESSEVGGDTEIMPSVPTAHDTQPLTPEDRIKIEQSLTRARLAKLVESLVLRKNLAKVVEEFTFDGIKGLGREVLDGIIEELEKNNLERSENSHDQTKVLLSSVA